MKVHRIFNFSSLHVQHLQLQCNNSLIFAIHSKEISHGYRQGGLLRGGLSTCHGPGQLCVYPIFDYRKKIRPKKYVEFLNQIVMDFLSKYNVEGHIHRNGVYIGSKKVAFFGVKFLKNKTIHGFCINVWNELAPFKEILPCGEEIEVTRLADHVQIESMEPLIVYFTRRLQEEIFQ